MDFIYYYIDGFCLLLLIKQQRDVSAVMLPLAYISGHLLSYATALALAKQQNTTDLGATADSQHHTGQHALTLLPFDGSITQHTIIAS
jgi:hypothetical protein